MRDKLLGRLPQPENIAAYREETVSLLEKREKAIFWRKKFPANVIAWLAVAVFITANSPWGPKLDTNGHIVFDALAGLLLFTGALSGISYWISRSKVDLLKEVKQVQLQILELQASLRKEAAGQ